VIDPDVGNQVYKRKKKNGVKRTYKKIESISKKLNFFGLNK
jgi:hypothetical protein